MKKIFKFIQSEIGRIVIGLCLFLPAIILEKLNYNLASLIGFCASLLVCGLPVFIDAVKGILRRDLLDEKFLMTLASVGAMVVGEPAEGVSVMLFFLIGECFEHKAVAGARKSIRSLMDIKPDTASVITENGEEEMDCDDVDSGSVIIIRAGERVPIDSIIIDGSSDVDTSALTGESLPRSVTVGDEISGGVIVLNGVLKAKTLRAASESASARILDLVEKANERKSKTEKFITKFSHFYTPIVVCLALLLAFMPPIFSILSLKESVYRALIFLVISCPCALVISVPMAFFAGIGCAASRGILYKGGNTFSALAKADAFVFDKTGTLTDGKFVLSRVEAFDITKEELLLLASSAEYGSNHPIAECIKAASEKKITPTEVYEYSGRGIRAKVDDSDVLVGNLALMSEFGVGTQRASTGSGVIYVSKDGILAGELYISDKIKNEASDAVKELYSLGIRKTVILSGDKEENVKRVAEQLQIKTYYSTLLPEEKYDKMTEIISSSKSTVYVGDGINDAPVLALSDVGIAMGEIGADSAIESSDVVIMSDNLKKLKTALQIARKTVNISVQNIILALGIKIAVMILGAFGIANMWLAVFADVGVAVLAILNSMRALKIKE